MSYYFKDPNDPNARYAKQSITGISTTTFRGGTSVTVSAFVHHQFTGFERRTEILRRTDVIPVSVIDNDEAFQSWLANQRSAALDALEDYLA